MPNYLAATPNYSVVTRASGVNYDAVVRSLNPSAYWKLDEAFGSTSFADTSKAAVGGSLSIGGTGVIAGNASIVPGFPLGRSVGFVNLGNLQVAANTIFDYSSATAFSVCLTLTNFPAATFELIFSKLNVAGNAGYDLLRNDDGTAVLRIIGGGNSRLYTFTIDATGATHLSGIHHLIISQPSNWSTSPTIYVDGVSVTVSASGTAPASASTTEKFAIGARATDNVVPWGGLIQCFAFWSGTALTTTKMDRLYASHQGAMARLPVIMDTDAGQSDADDIIDLSMMLGLHAAKVIDIKGIIATASPDGSNLVKCAAAVEACRAYYDSQYASAGFLNIRIGSYQATDLLAAVGGGPADLIVTAQGAPYTTRVKTDYDTPTVFFDTILDAASNSSVVVIIGGPANSTANYLAGGASKISKFNQKVKMICAVAGQWPNSSDAASPVGNFAAAGNGEFNIGNQPSQPAAWNSIITNVTVPIHWHGIEICGGAGNSPGLAQFINSVCPVTFSASNPLRQGGGTSATTAWGQLGSLAAINQARIGTGGGIETVNDITAPTITDPAGQNSSSAGSSNHHYFSSKLGSLSLAQWRTSMNRILNSLHPTKG